MKISLNWVKEFTDIKVPLDQLLDKIGAQLGAIDEVIETGKKYEGILIAKVISCQNHPNADKLKLCLIDDGRVAKNVKRNDQGYVQVVCGAPNVKEGMFVAWLPPGATVPATFASEPLVLEKREIRGEVSNGMIASSKELDISDDHRGILQLNPYDGKPGDSFVETYKLNDHIIDIENKMFTHRPDCFGILGVAREIAGIQHLAFQSPGWYAQPLRLESSSRLPLEIKVEDSKLTPRFAGVAMAIKDTNAPIVWMQTYLSRVGIRPINTIVDITNYMMHLSGQPLHAYDYDKVKALSGTKPTLIARLSKKGETLKLLNGKTITFDEPALVIATDKQVVGIAGVMGGADTEVDENTKRIIIECASFDMYSIRKTAMRYGVFSDAVTRFTKNQSPLQNDRVLALTISQVKQLANGEVASRVHDVKARNLARDLEDRIVVDPGFVNARLGTKLALKDMKRLLENVEFKIFNPPAGKSQLYVQPPFWRTDIHIQEDIVEEIGRLYGYDHLPLDLPKRNINPTAVDSMLGLKNQLRRILAAAGANEVLTYSFVHGDLMKKAGQDPKQAFQLSNALSPDLQFYRPSLLPSLLDKVHPNVKAGFNEFAIFEINQTHSKDLMDKEEKVPIEEYRLGFVFAADEKTASQKYSGAPYFQAKLYLEELLRSLNIVPVYESADGYEPKLEVSRQAIAPFEQKRTSLVKTSEGEFIGELGELKPSVIKNFKLPHFTAGFEIDVKQLLRLRQKTAYQPLPRYPKVQQDITLRVENSVDYQTLHSFLSEQTAELHSEETSWSIDPADIYQKEKSHKQLTFRLNIASYSRTLTTDYVNELLDKMAGAAKVKFGAERI